MKDLPKGWVYAEEDVQVKSEESHDPNQYHHLHQPLTHTMPTRTVAPLQPPEGFIHNIGADFMPLTITNEHGVPTPARFIQVHMTADPYVIGQLTVNGADYCTELHVTPNDNRLVQHISDHALHMFN